MMRNPDGVGEGEARDTPSRRTQGATEMLEQMRRDVRTVLERDPAARSAVEVVLCTPGVHAIWIHRVAHRLWGAGWKLGGRWLSHVARFLTGIEIHPAAVLGPGLFIDHGMGIVIGETAEIGENVSILQGVTLGGTSAKREKRHPTIGDNVTIGAGAAVLGGFTIGAGSRIGAGSVVVREGPENCVVVGVPGRITFRNGERVTGGIDLNQTDLPDPLARTLEQMADRIHSLEAELERLKKMADAADARTH
jgi:serine O-acetyltransferase